MTRPGRDLYADELAAIANVACPRCKAKPHDFCHGQPRVVLIPHKERVEFYAQNVEELQKLRAWNESTRR